MNRMEGPNQHIELWESVNRHEDYVGAQGINPVHKEDLGATLGNKFNLILCASTYNLKRIKL